MRRLTLAGQIALIVTVAVFLAQAINLVIAINNSRGVLLGNAVVPAADRLAAVAAAPDRVPTPALQRPPSKAVHGHSHQTAHQVDRQPTITATFPARSDAQRERRAEAVLAQVFAQQSVAVPELRAVTVMEGANREPVVLLAARLADGRWVSVQSGPQQPLLPLIGTLVLQALLIAVVVLLPTLLLLRRVGGSLTRLAQSAAAFDPRTEPRPVTAKGPRDVRSLVEAINAMQSRITAMVRERDIMLGAIGHDLRTPLTALRLEVEGIADDERRGVLIEQIEQLHDELEQILSLARASQPAALHDVIDIGALATEIAGKYSNGKVTLGAVAARGMVAGDRHALRRAITNLIDNALRYAGAAELDAGSDGDAALITVSDRGPGLSADERARAAEPFTRFEPSRNRSTGGHGLGLAIVSAIVQAHRGQLELTERDGGGLVATIRLPALIDPARG